MNNDIVVKQKPGTEQPPQSAAPQPSEAPPADKPVKDSPLAKNNSTAKSRKPVGVITVAVIISISLITIALYIGYNQS